MIKKIKVLVVDDSAFMRKIISEILMKDVRITVVGTARNGKDALMKRKELHPDVITLDVEMPVMNGLETLKKLMEDDPCPVVMISSTTKEGTTNTLLAMEYGAVDFITKPSGAISLDMDKIEQEMAQKVIQASKVRMKQYTSKKEMAAKKNPSNICDGSSHLTPTAKKPLAKGFKPSSGFTHRREVTEKVQSPNFFSDLKKERPKPFNDSLMKRNKRKIVAIGTSTGGPKALKEVITELPASINAPILIVQHMPAHFTRSLAERLHSISNVRVREARDGEQIENGTVYIAPGGFHMGVREVNSTLYIRTHLEEPQRGHRPSVDKLYESLSELTGVDIVAVIMTGMGADGAEGLMTLKQRIHCYALAEAEESCVVYGMPKAAVKTNLVDEIVPVEEIGKRITMICQ